MKERMQLNTRIQAEQLLSCRNFVSFFRIHAEREKLLNKLVLFLRACDRAV